MDCLVIRDFANGVRKCIVDDVVRVYISEGPMRVWVMFQPGSQMVEAKNVEAVLEWGRQARKLEDF